MVQAVDYLAMGGYAAFVWPAFLIAAVVMGALLAVSLRGLGARRAELEALQGSRAGAEAPTEAGDEA